MRKTVLNYNGLWNLLVDHNINKTQLRGMAQISANAVAKMSRFHWKH